MRHGWFIIPGVQTGEREIAEQIAGLGKVYDEAPGSTVLDVGCAEGLLGRWLLEAGAALVHGVDKHEPYLQVARAVVTGKARFMQADLDAAWPPLLPRYDIVIALHVLQKLAKPEDALKRLAGLCGRVIAIGLPEPVLVDARSGNRPLYAKELLLSYGFELIDERPTDVDARRGNLGHRMVFRRRIPHGDW